jgi:hypothetical protein
MVAGVTLVHIRMKAASLGAGVNEVTLLHKSHLL